MSLGHPVVLVVALLVAAALVVLAVRLTRRRQAALATAGVAPPGRKGVPVGLWLSLAAVVVLAIAVANPLAELPVGRSAGTVILAMDVSNSMGATDVAPTRLVAAQQAAQDFVDAQPDTVDIGVVGFDQGALTTSLPTADRAATKKAIDDLRLSGGTSLASAILGSLSAITGKTVTVGEDGAIPDIGFWGSATIVLVSDGQVGDGSAAGTVDDATVAATTAAQNAGVHIETVGVGTAEGTNVAVDGFQLHTALDAERLTAIAQATGGSYHPATDASELDGIASGIDLRLTVARQDVPLAGAFAGLALGLLAVGAVLTGIRTGRLV